MPRPPRLAAVLAATFPAFSIAAAAASGQPRGIAFAHADRELACDNTRTCRAAGYQTVSDAEDESGKDLAVSVLLTRKAGPGRPVEGELHIGHYGEDDAAGRTPPGRSLTMRLDGKPAGQVALARGKWIAALAPAQTAALLAALPRRSRIEWTDGKRRWRLSDKGAAAILLKTDEYQGSPACAGGSTPAARGPCPCL